MKLHNKIHNTFSRKEECLIPVEYKEAGYLNIRNEIAKKLIKENDTSF